MLQYLSFYLFCNCNLKCYFQLRTSHWLNRKLIPFPIIKYIEILNWRASEASETLLGVYKFELMRYVYIYIYVYVIARVGVKFGINFTSVRLSGNKIARGEAECYLSLKLTRVKFVPEISRLTVLLKINTMASLLFF